MLSSPSSKINLSFTIFPVLTPSLGFSYKEKCNLCLIYFTNSIHFPTDDLNFPFFGWIIFHYVNIPHFLCPSVCGWQISGFHSMAIVSFTTTNMSMHVSLTYVFHAYYVKVLRSIFSTVGGGSTIPTTSICVQPLCKRTEYTSSTGQIFSFLIYLKSMLLKFFSL